MNNIPVRFFIAPQTSGVPHVGVVFIVLSLRVVFQITRSYLGRMNQLLKGFMVCEQSVMSLKKILLRVILST